MKRRLTTAGWALATLVGLAVAGQAEAAWASENASTATAEVQSHGQGEHAHRQSDDAHGSPGDVGHEEGHGHGAHVPHWSDVNWLHGMIGEKEGVEPSLLWRPPGTPVPVGAMILNTALLFFLLGRFFGPATRTGLRNRKKRIAGEIEAAAKMKEEAEDQLAYYEGQLAEMEDEMQRIKKEMREQAEVERKRVLEDARRQREAMERDAKRAIEQELAQARYDAMNAAVAHAVELAEQKIRSSMQPRDQERLATQMLGTLESHLKNKEVRS